jgi:prepilin-type N-terminal cleavage/methylation domain-containing protein
MDSRNLLRPQSGFSLIETLLVLTLLAVCFAVGGVALANGIGAVRARGAAASWQAAATWAQIGAVWQGEPSEVRFGSDGLSVEAETSGFGAHLGHSAPEVPVVANVVRWRQDDGVVVSFLGGSGHPDAAGSLFFRELGGDYRVTVRLESGLTVRTRVGTQP